MARRISGKLVIAGRLIARTPLSVGGLDGETDLPLAVDGRGEYHVPGTGLAGPLRHWAMRSVAQEEEALVNLLFGPPPGDEDGGHASWLLVRDGRVRLPDGTLPERRDGVGIDRRYGSAAPNIKYERQVLPRGSTIDLGIEVDLPRPELQNELQKDRKKIAPDPESVRLLLGRMVGALQRGEIPIGAAKTRGLGRVVLAEDVRVDLHDFSAPSNRAELLRWLRGEPSPYELPAIDETQAGGLRLTIEIQWRPVTAVMVKAGLDGSVIDMLPLVGAVDGSQVAAVLPGASVKGALRAHAERVARTIADRLWAKAQQAGRSARRMEAPDSFNDQINQVRIIQSLFGTSDNAGWISVADLYQDAHRLDAEDFRDERFGSWGQLADHVAIDRFTGGAADGALYHVLAPPADGWEPIRIDVVPRGEAAEIAARWRSAVALLLFVLRDVAEGEVTFGFGGRRGMGEVQVTEIRVRASGLADPADLPELITIDGRGRFSELGSTGPILIDALDESLRAQVEPTQTPEEVARA